MSRNQNSEYFLQKVYENSKTIDSAYAIKKTKTF